MTLGSSTRRLAVVLLLISSATACSSTSKSNDKVLSAQELADGLLVTTDLEGSWKLNTGPQGANLSETGIIDDANRDKLPQVELCDTVSSTARDAIKSIKWQAFRQLDKSVSNPIKPPSDREGHMVFIQEWLTSDDATTLTLLFTDLSDAVSECLGDIPAGEEGPGTITRVDITPVGDQSVAALARFEEAGGGGTWNIYSVFVRSGTVLMALTAVDIVVGNLEAEFTVNDLNTVLSSALTRL